MLMFPLSKAEKRMIRQIREKSKNGKIISLTDAEDQEMSDILQLLCEKEVLHDINADNENWYAVIGDFDVFENWVLNQERKVKKLSRREWWIAIISAVIGALLGALPTIIPLITSLLEEM